MTRPAVLVALALVGCRSLPPREGEQASEPLRLCIENATNSYGNVIAYAGLTRFDVMSGQQVCKTVLGTDPGISLRATTTAGGANGPLSFSNRLLPGGTRCWTWRLTDSPASAYDLTPCEDEPAPRRDSTQS